MHLVHWSEAKQPIYPRWKTFSDRFRRAFFNISSTKNIILSLSSGDILRVELEAKIMSFFNLTELGYQYPIRAQVKEPNPVYSYHLANSLPAGSYVSHRPETAKLPPINMHKYNKVIEPVDNPEHHGSYVKFTERLHKHTRCAKGRILNFYLMSSLESIP